MRATGELAALGTAFCWTVTALSFEVAGKRVGSLVVNLLRLLAAIALLALWGSVRRGLPLPTDATAATWFWLSLSGIVGFAVGDLCLFRAFVLIGSRLSMLLMALVPPMTAFLGRVVLREQLARLDWLGMGLTTFGVVWAVLERPDADPPSDGDLPTGDDGRTSGDLPDLLDLSAEKRRAGGTAGPDFRQAPPSAPNRALGVALGLVGALGQAGGLVLSKHGMGAYDAFAATQIRVLAGAVTFALLFTAIRWWGNVGLAFNDRRGLAYTGLGAFFGPFLGVSLSLVAVQATHTGVAATLMSLTPVLIIPLAHALGRERASWRSVWAALVAVGGSALLFL